MSAFDTAFALLKIDEGMWEEIYAPLLAQTTGMGKLKNAEFASDFVPTQFALDNVRAMQRPNEEGHKKPDEEWLNDLRGRNDTGDHGFNVEQLAESILEHGFDPSMSDTGRIDPTFNFDQQGTHQYEGRHRLLALDKLGAPHVPYMGNAVQYRREGNPYSGSVNHRQPLGGAFKHTMDNRKPYSLGAYIDRSHIPVPPSYLYGREMVPGMGRLEPVNRLGEPIDMLTHIDDRNGEDPLDQHRDRNQREPLNPFDAKSVSRNQKLLQDESLRNNAKWDWKKQPSWKVVHDE
mgnify:FL=1